MEQVRIQVWDWVRVQVVCRVLDQIHNRVLNPVFNQIWVKGHIVPFIKESLKTS